MTSTTTNRREIVDFLWEWAGSVDWSMLLVENVVRNESELSESEREVVFNHFLQSIGLHTGLPALTIVKPTYTPTSKEIELDSLSEVTGVNRLAQNQTINFSKNLTVIFGENGTGKTGYGRILKSLGFSYDTNNTILPNIFTALQPQTATIKFKTNGTEEIFGWNGTNRNADLENVSVFNSNCVQFALSDRRLIVSPIGFHLFNLITEELGKLSAMLQLKIGTHSTLLPWSVNLNLGTPQQNYINALSRSSDDLELQRLSAYDVTQEAELTRMEQELATLNRTLLENEIKSLNFSIAEITTNVGKVQLAQTYFTQEKWIGLIALNGQIAELEARTQTGIQQLAEANGIAFYESRQFLSFLNSAEEYVRILEQPDYPIDGDKCIYCLQPLEQSARELLLSYKALLNDTTQQNLVAKIQERVNLIRQISQIDVNLIFHQHTFGTDEEQKPIQPAEITEYNRSLRELKEAFVTNTVGAESVFAFNYQGYIDFLTEKNLALDETLTEKRGLLANLEARELQLKSNIAEFKDRKSLSEKIEEIRTTIANHKIIYTLNSNSGNFNSSSVSRKTTEAREALVRSNFENMFQEELRFLRKPHLNIDLTFGTDRGNSKVAPRISSHVLTDILSEGEQKAVSMAEFLTELRLDNIKAPVIFDDPVNSLDHNIIDDVAKRLIRLSAERQIIVFTHSVLLFNSFLYFSKNLVGFSQLTYKFYNSKNEYDETGVITESEELNKVNYYVTKINTLLNNTPRDRPEADVAEDGYSYLRSAIELLVEHEIFEGAVKRYQKNIALTLFAKVNGAQVDTHKGSLNEIFERCSIYTKAHSNPGEIYSDPTMAELRTDFDEFRRIRTFFPRS